MANLPKDMTKVANDPKWAQMKKPILSPSAKGKPPTIFYSNKPAEVILFQGQPTYANIPGTQLIVRDQHRCRSLRLYSDPGLLLPGGGPLVQGS